MANDKSSNVAVLIDGDNLTPKIVVGLMNEIANYGSASVRRIYGDWTQPSSRGWKDCLNNHSILPIQQFAYTNHKNSTDGAMIIDAMDLLYTNRFTSFCLVSSVSDFTRLAARIPCNRSVYLDVLDVSPRDSEVLGGAQARLSQAANTSETTQRPRVHDHVDRPKKALDSRAISALTTAIAKNINQESGYANLADVGNYLSKIAPDLNARNYGYDRLRDFVEASQIATLKPQTLGDDPSIALVRLKDFQERRPT